MYELYRIGAFTDAGGYALNGAKPYVAGRKNSRDAGLQQPRFAFERPAFRVPASALQIRSSQEVAFLIAVYKYAE